MRLLCRWNFTVGELEISLVEGEQEAGVGREEGPSCLSVPGDWMMQVDSSQGVLNAVRRWPLAILCFIVFH